MNTFDEIDSEIESRFDKEEGTSDLLDEEEEIKDSYEPNSNADPVSSIFEEDDEVKDIYRIADENIKNVEEEINLDEDENESMLQSILNSDDEEEIDNKISQKPSGDIKNNGSGEKSTKDRSCRTA